MVSFYPSSSSAPGSSSDADAFANPNDGPGSASPLSFHYSQAPSDRLITYIEYYHKKEISWHITLNNHSSTRPDQWGGKTIHSLDDCKQYTRAGSGSTNWRCTLDLPNSYAPQDGLRVCVFSEAPKKKEASNQACRLAFIHLLIENPGKVVLGPLHWHVSINHLLANMPESLPPHQALPVHVRGRMNSESATERWSDPPHVWKDRVAKLLRDILNSHGGTFDPSHINHNKMGRTKRDPHAYEELNKLLKPNELKEFVHQHPDFAWEAKNKKGIVIKWSNDAAAKQEPQ